MIEVNADGVLINPREMLLQEVKPLPAPLLGQPAVVANRKRKCETKPGKTKTMGE